MKFPFRRRSAAPRLGAEVLGTVIYTMNAAGSAVPVGYANPLPAGQAGAPVLLWDGPGVAMPGGYSTAYPTWANGTAAGTVVNLDIPLPQNALTPVAAQRDAIYAVIIKNPSTTSGITCNVRNAVSFNGGTVQHANVDGSSNPNATGTAAGSGGYPLNVAANTPSPVCFLVQGWMLGSAGRLSLSNDSVIADGSTVTADVQVWRIG